MAGSARGRKLKLPGSSLGVRPILARTKKSLFDILSPRLRGSVFVDLFAGTGAVGIEALSRGARNAVFVEKEPECVRVIKENLEKLDFQKAALVYRRGVEDFVERSDLRPDLIFMGPPYRDKTGMLFLSMPVIRGIEKKGMLKKDGILLVQHHKREVLEDCGELVIFREKKYGDTIATFYRYRGI